MVRSRQDRNALLVEIARFVVVGGLAFLLDAGLLRGAVWLGAPPLAGRIFSLAVTVVFTWLVNRHLTFASSRPPSWGEFSQYLAASLIGLAINYAIFSAAVLLDVPLLVALAAGTLAGASFNFVRYRALLKDRPPPAT